MGDGNRCLVFKFPCVCCVLSLCSSSFCLLMNFSTFEEKNALISLLSSSEAFYLTIYAFNTCPMEKVIHEAGYMNGHSIQYLTYLHVNDLSVQYLTYLHVPF